MLDFESPQRWQRVFLRDMIHQNELVFLEAKRIVRMAYPVDRTHMICFSEYQLDRLLDYILQMLGIEKYLDYVLRKVPRKAFLGMGKMKKILRKTN